MNAYRSLCAFVSKAYPARHLGHVCVCVQQSKGLPGRAKAYLAEHFDVSHLPSERPVLILLVDKNRVKCESRKKENKGKMGRIVVHFFRCCSS